MMNALLPALLLALILVGCSAPNAENQESKAKAFADSLLAVLEREQERALAEADSIAAAMDTATVETPVATDTTAQPAEKPEPAVVREKVTIFHADTLMLEGRSYPVFAEVGLKDSLKVAIERLLAEENPERTLQLLKPLTSNDLRTSDLAGAVEVELKLVAPAGDFEITSYNNVPRKNVDEEAGHFQWHWTVVPTRPTPRDARTTLELQVTYWRADGQPRDGTRRRLAIAVQVDERNMVIRFWQYLRQNPGYTIPSIIIPLLTAAWGFRWARQRRRKS